jgi:hypothetical protein
MADLQRMQQELHNYSMYMSWWRLVRSRVSLAQYNMI